MKFLVITDHLPMPDRASGELRFYTLLKLFSESHQVTLCPFHLDRQIEEVGQVITKKYQDNLEVIGITIGSIDIFTTLRNEHFEIVIFEFYHYVNRYIDYIRFYQPKARILIDSVDIHYNRYFSKANLTKLPEDREFAENVKNKEISAYQSADMVIAVTKDDKMILHQDAPDIEVGILPNVHNIPDFISKSDPYNKLLFVGSFNHEPNIDAVLYFCKEIFPILLKDNPNFSLDIIGPNPPKSVKSLQSDKIIIHGFVESLDKYYRNAHISIAPLRFGGGMKGKIGEALSYGLPVVTTKVGAEGFGLESGKDILVANTEQEFAQFIHELNRNKQLYEKISINGYQFIKDNYSKDATKIRIDELINKALSIPCKKLDFSKKTKYFLKFSFDRYIGWRFKKI